jgi:two-component system, sensor histidine kinase RegB
MTVPAQVGAASSAPVPADGRSQLPARLRRRRLDDFRAETDSQLGLSWLLQLRWGAVAGQLVVLLSACAVLDLSLPYVELFALVAFTAASNALVGSWRGAAHHDSVLPALLALDVLVLTAMLGMSGAAANPFTTFFLVHVALAALLQPVRLAWSLVWLTISMFGVLLVVPSPHPPEGLRVLGTWLAYALAAGFVAHFVGRLSGAMRERDRRLAEVARLTAQNERLAALSSFSGDAAHELGSPLATIGVASRELLLGLQRASSSPALVADAQLICEQVSRCREILGGLSARAGESMGEMPARRTLAELMGELEHLVQSGSAPPLRVTYAEGAAPNTTIVAPIKTLAQTLRNLAKNAAEAQAEAGIAGPVELRVEARGHLCFHVLDRGKAPPPCVRERLGEPFVTTKAERGGLGLGVYLARTYAERTNGYLLFHAREGGGSDVELCLPPELARSPIRGGACDTLPRGVVSRDTKSR